MNKLSSNWQYTEHFHAEPEPITRARRLSLEFGIAPVSRATAAVIASTAVMTNAKKICELGTGCGVSGLSLLRHLPQATLTSVDIESEFQNQAKPLFQAAGIAASRYRFITQDASQMLPRFENNSYDLLLIDANPSNLLGYIEHGLLVVRQGGSILVPNALWHGQVADPAARDSITTNFRDLLAAVVESTAVATSLTPTGNGLLTITKLAE
ncbi:class I SAM-dependent methyltransferase [Canibacter sp. lx-72]|uniref:O-methyltransferase n=1 Tax=Canibacter zhuwentaonis TaxID=2837491 RepID=UPI001BDC36CA|nr:class I SAM-dependent methyltransferase [Canibacter zhuwentaonis]